MPASNPVSWAVRMRATRGRTSTTGGGPIVQFSSVGGRVGGSPGIASYQAAKFAVDGFSPVLAVETAPFGITRRLDRVAGAGYSWAGLGRLGTPVTCRWDIRSGKFMVTTPIETYDRHRDREATVPISERPTRRHAIAAVLNVAISIFGVIFALPVMQGGAANSDQVPFPVIIFGFALSLLGLVSSYGVWRRQRWGVVLTIVINALSFISGAPGILFGPTTFLVVGSIVGCIVNVVIIYLLLRPARAEAGAVAGAEQPGHEVNA